MQDSRAGAILRGSSRETQRRVEGLLIFITGCLALAHTWAGRFSMSPDGISYLDVGNAFFRRDWFGAFNAYWSPLYAWFEGLVLGLVKPSAKWELPVAHAVNFLIFLATFLAFRFLVHSCLKFRQWASPVPEPPREFLSDWAVLLLAYPMFWWASFELMPLYEIGPDLALSACVYAAAAMLLRARMSSLWRDFIALGFILGVGYWVKAPFFLLAFAFLGVAYIWGRRSPGWSRSLALALAAFVVTASPLFFALSLQKHRPTFGDSGRLNYAWFIAPQTFHRNWQGKEPGSGTPVHPTHQVMQEPPVYTFEGPVVGSYPPWLDPSYWNEGLLPQFALRPQIHALATDLISDAALLLRAQPALLVAVLFLLALGGMRSIGMFWPLLAIALCAFALYAPVHVEPRFLGGFVLLVFLAPIAGVRLPKGESRAGAYLAIAVFSVMTIGALDTAVRFATLHPSVPGNGPTPAVDDIAVAAQLRQSGLLPGDSVAVIGDGTGAYWAHLAKLRIVAEVMGADHDALRFWKSSGPTQQAVLQAFAASGAKVVVAENPPAAPGPEWMRIANTNRYMRWLTAASSPPFH